jgi:hypothetical protein
MGREMTPEACYSALALFDRWRLTLAQLQGQPLPEPPQGTGRKCRPLGEIPDSDPHAEAWDADNELASDTEGGSID